MNTYNINRAGSGLTLTLFGYDVRHGLKHAKERGRGASVFPTIPGAGMGRQRLTDENIAKLAAFKAKLG